MKDLTKGSIPAHLLRLSIPIALGMLFQTLYVLVDLYFVARLGDAAIAGVGAAANGQFLVMALSQVLGVGTMALIAHATGRKDHADANLVFNQSLLLGGACGIATLVAGYALTGPYLRGLAADAATVAAGTQYLYWFLPGLALQFALVPLASALRGTGIAMPTMVVQLASVVLNALLAPVLIAGWLTGKPLGVAGAGLASSIAIAFGVVLMLLYFLRLEKFVHFDRSLMRARFDAWKRILRIGLPPGGEFALMFVYMVAIYWVIRPFGAEAQAGFGIGQRVMQAIFLPAMAIAFAVAPLAGQNMGGGQAERVRGTFRSAVLIGSAIMLVLTLLAQWRPAWLIGAFTTEPEVIAVGTQFLQIISWNFVATGLNFTCSGMFQALGNTVPPLIGTATRLVTFALPAVWLAQRPGFELKHLWLLSVATVLLQAAFNLWMLRREFARKLMREPLPQPAAV